MVSDASGAGARDADRQGFSTADLIGRTAPLLFLLVLIAVLAYLEPGFRTERNNV